MSPKKVVGCRGGSRHVEGCWGFPYLKIEKFVGFTKFHFMFLVDMTLISKIWEMSLLLRAAWFSIFGDAPTPKHMRCLEPDLRCVCDTWLISLQYVYHQHMNAHDPNDPKKCQALASVRRASLVPRAPSRGHSLEASVEPLASRTNADCRLMAKIHYA